MSNRWGMARPGRGSEDGWFRLGSIDVNTVLLVVVLVVVSVIEWAVEPMGKPVQNLLTLDPDPVLHGQLWRLVTWPIAYPGGIGLFDVVAIFIFWYFGTEIESQLGRKKMAWFLGLVTVGLALLWMAVVELSSLYDVLSSLGQLELMVLLLFIAENPHRRFFFNIPGWVIGVIIVAIEVLRYVGKREGLLLLNFALGLVLTAIVARSMGLLGDYGQIPAVRMRRRSRGGGRAPRPRGRRTSGPTVVAGPWQSSGASPGVSRDQAALDALLDKISAGGMESLTDRERKELMALRERLRRR